MPEVIHYPKLDTILMVENHIKKNSGTFRKKKLWQELPKKMMYQTFSLILDYLEQSGKIAYDEDRKIAWIFNPTIVKQFRDNAQLRAA